MSKIYEDVIPAGHIYIRGNVLEKGNIFGVEIDKGAWANNLNLPRKAEYIFFAGCSYQLMRYAGGVMQLTRTAERMGLEMGKVIGISKALSKVGIDIVSITGKITSAGKEDPYTKFLTNAIKVLKKLGVDIGYLYEDEPCCGSPLYYCGFIDDYAESARKSYEVFKSFGVKKIIGFVPACTNSLENLYPKFVDGYDLEVKHFIEVVAQKLKQRNMRPKLEEKMVVTYHDPCQLSRYLCLVMEPRKIISVIEDLELKEVEAMQNGEWSTCCGGGGLEVSNPELSERLAVKRVEELLKTGATTIVTSCPACIMQLSKGREKLKATVAVTDLVQILDDALR